MSIRCIDLRDLKKGTEEYEIWEEAIIEYVGCSVEEAADNEPIMIDEDNFVEYAQELAEELGLIDKNMKWPYNCIDWEDAASELEYDYSRVEVDGITWLFRSW